MRSPSNSDLLLADRVEKQLLDELSKMSDSGHVRLPQQEELTRRYGVSIRTIRTVVSRLKQRRLIRSIKGKGMFLLQETRPAGNVIVLAENFSRPFTSMATSLGNDILLRRGYTPVMSTSRELAHHAANARSILVFEGSPHTEQFLSTHHLPYCGVTDVFDPHLEQSPRYLTIRPNSYRWGFLAASVLLAAGKKRICLFVGKASAPCHQAKFRGCTDALRCFGLTENRLQIFSIPDYAGIDVQGSAADIPNKATIQTFCTNARKAVKKFREADRQPPGVIDFDGVLLFEGSVFHRQILQGICRPEDTVTANFQELSMAFCRPRYKVMFSITSMIERAIDLVSGSIAPIAQCEDMDSFHILTREEDRWKPVSLDSVVTSHFTPASASSK